MSEDVITGSVVTSPPDELPANVKDSPATGTVAVPDYEFLYKQGDKPDLEEGDPFRRIIDQVLSATSPDVVLTPVEVVQAKDLIAVPLLLFGFVLNESEYDAGSPMYASMECQNADTGESVVVNTGHKKMLAQLVKLREFNQFPYKVQVRARGQSSQGTPMLELVKWSRPADSEPPF